MHWRPARPVDWFLQVPMHPAHGCYGNKAPVWRHVRQGEGRPFPRNQRRDSKPKLPLQGECEAGMGPRKEK